MGAILDMEPSRSQTKADQITKAGFSVRKVQAAWWRERSVSERTLHFSLTSLALFEALLLSPNLFVPGFPLDSVGIWLPVLPRQCTQSVPELW